ncbi:MAG TPA: YncE family protein [Hanamia sp.]|nr:YncE family protein [Hanamia sp.]
MPSQKRIPILAFILPALFFFTGCDGQTIENSGSLQFIQAISLPDITGRIDHLSFDSRNEILFVAALGNNTVEVVDLKSKKIIHSVKNLSEPQGIVFLPAKKELAIANGGTGAFDLFDSAFHKTKTISLGNDADNVRYDDSSDKIYVGYGEGGIAVINANNFSLLNQIRFSGHPESFQIDKSMNRLFVNDPDEKQIDVIDLSKNKVTAQWKLNNEGGNFPMALDESHHRLFIGCRHPSKLLVFDTQTGKVVSSVEIDGDADDVFYDSSKKEIYASCGSGYIDVISQTDPDNYKKEGRQTSAPGARTSLFISKLDLLIVAAPARMNTNAQLLVYKIK